MCLLAFLQFVLKTKIKTTFSINSNAYRRKIRVDFKQVLYIKYLDLTKLDVKLAALIVMNMSNKDIGISKNITPESVKIAKNRLKKKLSLSKEDDLHEHLN